MKKEVKTKGLFYGEYPHKNSEANVLLKIGRKTSPTERGLPDYTENMGGGKALGPFHGAWTHSRRKRKPETRRYGPVIHRANRNDSGGRQKDQRN